MLILFKIAFRNVTKNRKRSLLIGIALFIPCLIMILTNSAFNGAEDQVLKSYVNIQAGEIAVMWSNVRDLDRDKPDRMYRSHFDLDKDGENKKALDVFEKFIKENNAKIEHVFPTILRGAAIYAGRKKIDTFVFNLTKEGVEFMLSTGTLKIEEGVLSADDQKGIIVSRQYADDHKLAVGDEVFIDCNTIYGARNRYDFIIRGIYANGPGWLNSGIYMPDKPLRELYDFDNRYFDLCRIFLKNPADIKEFADQLNNVLALNGGLLLSEDYLEASTFYPNFVNSQRTFYAAFSVFLFFVIALGIRSTVRMNIFERMGEFATLRAIGYSRFKTFLVIFLEIVVLTVFSLIAAFAAAFVITMIVRQNGVYVGTGPISYMFGGDRFFPVIRIYDVVSLMVILFALSVYSPLKPALSLCFQKIADILIKRQRRFFIIPKIVKNIFNAG